MFQQHTKYIGGVAAGQALILLSSWVIHLPFIFFAKSNTMQVDLYTYSYKRSFNQTACNIAKLIYSHILFSIAFSFQAFITTIIIVSANGLIWPYVVIWASSQAKKESLSFLRTIRDIVSTGNFVSFETKKKNEQRNFQNSVVEWKRSERNTKHEKSIQGAMKKSKDDSVFICMIQEEGYKQESEKVQRMRIKEENNRYNHASLVKDQVGTTTHTIIDMPLQTVSSMTTEAEPMEDEVSPNQDESQLMTLSLLISNHEGAPKRQRSYSRSGLDSSNLHSNEPKDKGINCSIDGKVVKNLKSSPMNNTWTENDMVYPQRKHIQLYSNKSFETNNLGSSRGSYNIQNTTKDITAGITKEKFVLPVESNHLKVNSFCSLNVPTSSEFMQENSDCLKSASRIKFSKRNISDSKRRNSKKNKTVKALTTIISDNDNPTKNNVNFIMDPIRKCNNMESIHLGDYDDAK